MNYETLQRTFKASAKLYADIIASNGAAVL